MTSSYGLGDDVAGPPQGSIHFLDFHSEWSRKASGRLPDPKRLRRADVAVPTIVSQRFVSLGDLGKRKLMDGRTDLDRTDRPIGRQSPRLGEAGPVPPRWTGR